MGNVTLLEGFFVKCCSCASKVFDSQHEPSRCRLPAGIVGPLHECDKECIGAVAAGVERKILQDMRMRRLFLASTALLAGLAAGAGTPHAATAPVVSISAGRLQGSANGIQRYLGIPYAASPVGSLRWRPPQAAASWSGIRQATQYGPHCAQAASAFGKPSGSEDCLYLNVFTSSTSGAPRPVMVWIHGGFFGVGESDDYDGTALVTAGNVVVVTINYRLGAFGFLANGALAAEAGNVVGNYGLLDQQAALRWVKANIASFGGDPGNVTIFGESAGGSSVSMQVASPAASGLFQHAIIESGFYDPAPLSPAQAEANGAAFAAAVGCASQSTACLRNASTATVVRVGGTPFNAAGPDALAGEALYAPVRGTDVLPLAPIAAYATGQFNHVPVLNGTNHDELNGVVAVGLDPSPDALALQPYRDETSVDIATAGALYASLLGGSVSAAVSLSAYLPAGSLVVPTVSRIGSDAIFSCTARLADRALAGQVPTYTYEFNVEDSKTLLAPPSGAFPSYGATHTNEIGYLYPTFASQFPSLGSEAFTAPQAALSATMLAAWTNFARNGNPNGVGVPSWAPYSAASDRFESLVAPVPSPEDGFALDHGCGIYDPFLIGLIQLPAGVIDDL